MSESHIILLLVIIVFLCIIIEAIYRKYIEKLTETIDINSYRQVYENDTSVDNDLLIPTKDMAYNQYDIYRPANDIPIQEQEMESESDILTTNVNTAGNTPIVYSRDELTHTTYSSPSFNEFNGIDAGSGPIDENIDVQNNKSVSFSSIN